MNHTDITPHIIPRRQWLVAYVQSCLEKKTAERLKAMGVEYYPYKAKYANGATGARKWTAWSSR